MNNTVTWQITVQPWQNSHRISVRVTRATYTTHGRQKWDQLETADPGPLELELAIQRAVDTVMNLYDNWAAAVDRREHEDRAGS